MLLSAWFDDAVLGLDADFASVEFETAGFDCWLASSVFTEAVETEFAAGSSIFAIESR